MDEVTRNKIVLLKGGVHVGAPCPSDLGNIIDLEQLPEDLQEAHGVISDGS